MAQMIPGMGPRETDSSGEKRLYYLLKSALPDDFVVIHSLPWLCAGVRSIDPSYAPTGEIDFLVIHEVLGVLAIEVKSGVHRVEGASFVHVGTGRTSDPVHQLRRNVHGLARWLGNEPQLRLRIGYGFVFPDSDFGNETINAALVDTSVMPKQAIHIDRTGLSNLADRVPALMAYWQRATGSVPLGAARARQLVQMLCPEFDGTPSWASRLEYNGKCWLRLTEEQAAVVDSVANTPWIVVTGWPGTGKTLIAVELARRAALAGKRVLALTFNSLLAEYLRAELEESEGSVSTWHGFCSGFARKLHGGNTSTAEWLERGCLEDLMNAEELGLVAQFDVLLIDEAQTLRREWCDWLARRGQRGQIIAFCDETQLFSFEKERISTAELCTRLGAGAPFFLTIPLRSPKAVVEHLQRVRSSSHQMYSPREFEEESLQEHVVADVDKALDETIERMAAAGVSRKDIVVLSKFGALREYAGLERYETVSRFRGMESPIIIVPWADGMDDAELFCAYSRATSMCIALYEAESLGINAPSGKFHELILANPINAAVAHDAAKQALTRTIISEYVESQSLGLSSADVRWCNVWNAWLVDCEDRSELAGLWIDYLICHHPWPVYSWTNQSRRELMRAIPTANPVDDGQACQMHKLTWCDRCEMVAPHERRADASTVCRICAEPESESSSPSPELLGRMKRYDKVVSSDKPESLPKEEVLGLPLIIAALGARKVARTRPRRHSTAMDELPTGAILYRAAMAFVYSRVSLLREGSDLVLEKLVAETGRYLAPPNVTIAQWRSRVALALGRSFSQDLVTKRSKGVYTTKPLDASEKTNTRKSRAAGSRSASSA